MTCVANVGNLRCPHTPGRCSSIHRLSPTSLGAAVLAPLVPAGHILLAMTLTVVVLLPVVSVHAGTLTAMVTVREARAAIIMTIVPDIDHLHAEGPLMTTRRLVAAMTTHTVATTLLPTRT